MQPMLTYFQQYYTLRSLGEITWAHAVNSQARLRKMLHNPQVLFIESDIRCIDGKLIAAHPPVLESDLSLTELLAAAAQTHQGLKLDFKDQEALEPCLHLLRASNLRQPVMLNADILQGNQAGPSRFDAATFLTRCRELYPEGLLSIGWTTFGDPSGAYTRANIEEMLELCQRHDVERATFPVRAVHMPTSWQHLAHLLNGDGYTLTAWGVIDASVEAWLRENSNPAVTYYDCFDEHGRAIHIAPIGQ